MSSKVEESSDGPVNYDRILVEEIGQFGSYQLRSLVLTAVMVIFVSWSTNEYAFTTARINSRCLIPECETLESASFSVPWSSSAYPAGNTCERYAVISNNATDGTVDSNATCSADSFDTNQLQSCDELVYQNNYSVAYDYDLGCVEWLRSLMGSLRTCGSFVAQPLTGYISDRWGRRTALVFNAINTTWLGIVRYWADTYAGFVISEFVEAAVGAGGFACAYILLMEQFGPKYRVFAGATMNTFFSVGKITMGLIAWAVPHWRDLTLALYIPMIITVAYYWLVSESVRWYMSKGRFADAEQVLKKAAKANHSQLSEKSLIALRKNVEEEERKAALEKLEKSNEPWLIAQIFHYKPILLRCCVSPVWWITTTFVYYGLSINAVNMSGNRYVNYVAVSAVEIPGYWTAVLLIGRVGRKPVLITAYWICAACQFGYMFLPEGQFGISLTLYLIGNYCISMVMTSMYVYTAELYPTRYRHNLFGFSTMMGRVGSIIAPLTPAFAEEIWTNLPFALFGGFALLSGALIFLTPETLGTKLPDTMEDACNLSNDKTNTT